MPRSALLLLTAILALAVAVPAASATVISGRGTDPAGDGPAAGRDIVGVEASYDVSGSVTASLTLAGAPDPMFFYLQIGTRSGTTCGAPFIALGGDTDGTAGVWGLDGDAPGDFAAATVSRAGAKLTITASGERLAGRTPNCVTGSLAPKATPGDPSPPSVDVVDVPATLAAPVAPPAPAPPAAPAPTPPPAPAPPAPAPKPVAKAAKLAVTITGVPTTIRRDHALALRVRVANTGTATAQTVRLRIGRARGLSVRPHAITTITTLTAGRSATRTVRLTLTRTARTTTAVSFTAAGAEKVVGRSRLALRIGKAKAIKKPSGPTPQAPSKGPLAGTYWWYTINHSDSAWDNHGVFFVDDRWAYRGIPKGGLPACSAATATTDAQGEETDGCLPYTYNSATGAVTLGSAAGTFKDGALTITDEGEEQSYSRLVVPDAGARYDVSLLHRSFYGLCGLLPGCTTSLASLRLLPDGQFVLSSSSTTTLGGAGSPIFTAVSSFPPDEHGTYDVQAGGRVRLAFADGTVKDRTFAIQTDKAGRPDPVNEGLMLDEDNYYVETD